VGISLAKVALMIASTTAGPTSSSHRCALGDATYISPVSHLRLSFLGIEKRRDLISDIAVHITEPRSHRQFWYYFDEGSAPKVSLISTTDVTARNWRPNPDGGERPYGYATFIGMRKSGEILFDAPSSKSTAPHYVLIPELAGVFKTIRLWGVDANAFVLTDCSKSPVAR
jgi:hypothetical protein